MNSKYIDSSYISHKLLKPNNEVTFNGIQSIIKGANLGILK